MPFVTTLNEAGELNGVSTRLEGLAELHPLVSGPLMGMIGPGISVSRSELVLDLFRLQPGRGERFDFNLGSKRGYKQPTGNRDYNAHSPKRVGNRRDFDSVVLVRGAHSIRDGLTKPMILKESNQKTFVIIKSNKVMRRSAAAIFQIVAAKPGTTK